MKRQAEETEEGTRQIVQHALNSVADQQAHLPSQATLSRDVCGHHQLNGLNDQQLEGYRNTIGGDEFIRIMAFVPIDDVPIVFEELVNIAAFQEIDYLIDYFEDKYIGRRRRGHPRFGLTLWNQYDRVIHMVARYDLANALM